MSTISAAINQKQYPYYCKTNYNYGRSIAEEHLLKCLEAGIKMSGMNAEVGPSQWEYQVGPCTGIEAGDQLWFQDIYLSVLPKNIMLLLIGPPNRFKVTGMGLDVINFSTKMMREGTKKRWRHILCHLY